MKGACNAVPSLRIPNSEPRILYAVVVAVTPNSDLRTFELLNAVRRLAERSLLRHVLPDSRDEAAGVDGETQRAHGLSLIEEHEGGTVGSDDLLRQVAGTLR